MPLSLCYLPENKYIRQVAFLTELVGPLSWVDTGQHHIFLYRALKLLESCMLLIQFPIKLLKLASSNF